MDLGSGDSKIYIDKTVMKEETKQTSSKNRLIGHNWFNNRSDNGEKIWACIMIEIRTE